MEALSAYSRTRKDLKSSSYLKNLGKEEEDKSKESRGKK